MESGPRRIGDILRERNIILKGADAATQKGFTQVPNFLLKSKSLSASDKLTFAMILSYAWQNDFCFPGQERLAEDMGVTSRSVRTNLKSLEKQGLLTIRRRGLGKTNIYELDMESRTPMRHPDRKKTSALERKQASGLERKRISDHTI